MDKTFKRAKLYIILFGVMILFGYVGSIKGVTYPLIKDELGVSYAQQGIMMFIISLSYVIFSLIGGLLIGSFGAKRAFTAGLIVMIVGFAAVFFMPGFWSITIGLVILLAGFGLFEVGSIALAAQLFTLRAALLMNLLYFFYGIGSIISPRASGAIALALGWREVYLFSIPMTLAFLIPSLIARFPDPSPHEGPQENAGIKKITIVKALKIPIVWAFSVVFGFMLVLEVCTVNWAGLYFQDVYQLDPKVSGATFLSNFYIFYTISRLVSGFVIEKIGCLQSLFIAALASAFIFLLGFILGGKGIHVLPVLGFFVAIFWPTMMAMSMGYFRADAPVINSVMIVIGGAVNSFTQYLIGITNRLVGPAWGYRSCLGYAILGIASLVFLSKRMRQPYEGERYAL